MQESIRKSFWLIYMLKCNDGSLYTGVTNNLEARLGVHRLGKGSKYVRSRRPFELIYTEEHPSKSDALKREHQIKRLSRDAKIQLITNTRATD